jgi:hypothetical protein
MLDLNCEEFCRRVSVLRIEDRRIFSRLRLGG